MPFLYIISMTTKTMKLNPKQINDLKKRYQSFPMRTDIPYAHFQVRLEGVTITAYESGKVVFQGLDAEVYANLYGDVSLPSKSSSDKKVQSLPDTGDMAGSDEVGTGDYFGPITVCAAVVTTQTRKDLPVQAIKDSKELTDETIRELAPQIMEIIPYSLLVLDNKKYNTIQKQNNMNAIKAKLHNKAYLNLEAKNLLPEICVIDQFAQDTLYYRYLENEPQIFKRLTFEMKAENKYLAVACAAIIARNAFLEAMDQLSNFYDMEFPKGAGKHVDTFGVQFVKKYGKDALNTVAKVHFANTERILNDAKD